MNLTKCRLLCMLLALVIVLAGCGSTELSGQTEDADAAGTDLFYAPLDRNKIDSETTTVADRAEYYKETVDHVVKRMTEEEQDAFYVTLNVVYASEIIPNDNLIFFRNDDVYEGDIRSSETQIQVVPGIYSVISHKTEENNGNLGEIELLVPGEVVTLVIDYDAHTATLERP